jgi:hypothetical protein
MFYIFWILMITFATTHAEIVKVNVQWQPETCPLSCAQGLAGQFQKIPGIAQINMNQSGGYAELRWKPGIPFIYAQIKSAMQAIGPGIRDIRVKVRGTLKFDKQTVSLTSLGDNTVFYLIGQINAKEGQTAVYYSLESHQLSQDMIARLVEGYQQQRIAVIEGPLFEPWRYPYLWLIVDQLQFVQSESAGK